MDQRLLKKEEQPLVETLWDYCFEKKDDPFFQWYFQEVFQYDRTLGSFSESGKLKSMLNLSPYKLLLRKKEIPVSYIVGVATWPEYRGQGEVKKLLKEAFVTMRQWKESLAILMPSRPEFYYPLDFQLYNQHLKCKIPMKELRELISRQGYFVEVEEKDIFSLDVLYKQAYLSYNGKVLRTPEKWKRWIQGNQIEGGKAYLYFSKENNTAEGYIFYGIHDRVFKISEWAGITPEARFGLMQFCYQHRAQADFAEFDIPTDDSLQYLLPEIKERVALFPFMTSRIVDISSLIENLPWENEGEVVVRILDPLLEWNQGNFLWQVRGGRATFQQTKREAEFEITIGGFSQWLFGEVNSRILIQAGFLKKGSLETYEILDQWMPKSPTYINEYF